MSESAAGIPISQPKNIWQRQVKVNPRSLFTTLGKAAVNGLFLQWDDLAENRVEVLEYLGLSRTPGEIAGLLIARSLLEAMKKLPESNAWATLCSPTAMDEYLFKFVLDEMQL